MSAEGCEVHDDGLNGDGVGDTRDAYDAVWFQGRRPTWQTWILLRWIRNLRPSHPHWRYPEAKPGRRPSRAARGS